MARGWESKSVESQVEDRESKAASRAAAAKTPLTAEELARAAHRQTLKVALARARADLKVATHPSHKQMLEAAIAALTEQLQ